MDDSFATSLGRPIDLPERSWKRITGKHRELRGCTSAVREAVESYEHRYRDVADGVREHFYSSRAPIGKPWLRVIVDFRSGGGTIVHAQGIGRLPRDLEEL